MAGCIEMPRPWELLRTAARSLGEAVGLPAGVCLAVGVFAGWPVGVVASVGAVWLAVAFHVLRGRRAPGLLMMSALMLSVQAVLVMTTGQAWIYLLQFPVAKLLLSLLFARSARTAEPLVARLAVEIASVRHPAVSSRGLHAFFQADTWLWAGVFGLLAAGFAVLVATQPMASCLLLCGTATVGAVCVGACISVVWFRRVLKHSGLRLTFAGR